MNTFSRLIGKLPLAGKLAIRPRVLNVRQSTTKKARWRNCLWLMLLLALFILLHGMQAHMGVQAVMFDAPVWAKAISALYALVNACVTVTQAHIVVRTIHFCLTAPFSHRKKLYPVYSDTQVNIMVATTFVGQAIFLCPYFVYRH